MRKILNKTFYFTEKTNDKICDSKYKPKKKHRIIPLNTHSWQGKNRTLPVNNS